MSIPEIDPCFASLLAAWYEKNARNLPWRQNTDPYRVWVSEIMLQQTRVAQAIEYYEHFMRRFADVTALANADEEEVLKHWEGLGYYSRAKNLHRAAKKIRDEFGGVFPRDYKSVRSLTGVGDYTAGTICAICFDLPTPSVDGNILRVIARLTGSDADISDEKTKSAVYQALQPLYEIPSKANKWLSWGLTPGQPINPGTLTQSVMELGATVCLPNGKPLCGECPIHELCRAYRENLTEVLPVKSAKKAKTTEDITVFVVESQGLFAVKKRPAKGILAGLWEFVNVPGRLSEDEAMKAAADIYNLQFTTDKLRTEKDCGYHSPRTCEFTHVFTHRIWNMRVYYFTCKEKTKDLTWARLNDIALPTAFRKLIIP